VTNDTIQPPVGIDYELITDSILRAASIQAAVSRPDDTINVLHGYECPQQHYQTVAMLLTVKVRKYNRLQYRRSLFDVHTFQVS
jgi:hypothetical protein